MTAISPSCPDLARRASPVLLVYAPTAGQRMLPSPPLGLAVLAGHLRRCGARVTVVDLEARTWQEDCWAKTPAARLARAAPLRLNNPKRPFLDTARVEAFLGGQRDMEIGRVLSRWEAHLPRGRYTHLGLSVMSLQQLATSLCLARQLHRRGRPRVLLGGSYITARLSVLLERYPFVDYLVLGEGEVTLERLLRGEDPGSIPGLVHRDRGRVIHSPGRPRYAGDLTPDFSGQPFQLYRQGGAVVLPIEMSKGCRNRCRFCITSRKPLQLKAPGQVVEEMARGLRLHGARRFMAVDNAINVSQAHSVAVCEALISARLDVRWSAYFIPEDPGQEYFKLLRRAGCVQLRWGLETPSSATLRRMGKQMDPVAVSRALGAAHDCGIWNHLLLMVGHPGEKLVDLARAVAFISHNRHAIRSALVSPLDLQRVDLSDASEEGYQDGEAPVASCEAFGVTYRILRSPTAALKRRLLGLVLAGCGVRYRRNFSRWKDRVDRDQFIFRALAEA